MLSPLPAPEGPTLHSNGLNGARHSPGGATRFCDTWLNEALSNRSLCRPSGAGTRAPPSLARVVWPLRGRAKDNPYRGSNMAENSELRITACCNILSRSYRLTFIRTTLLFCFHLSRPRRGQLSVADDGRERATAPEGLTKIESKFSK